MPSLHKSLGIFPKKILWSSNGHHLLSSLENNALVLFHPPTSPVWTPSHAWTCGDSIHDLAWTHDSTHFGVALRNHPIHLWNIHSKSIATSFVVPDSKKGLVSVVSIAFDPLKHHMYGGSSQGIHLWNMDRPGTPIDHLAINDFISSMSVSSSSLLATGSFAGTIRIHHNKILLCQIDAIHGTSQLLFSKNGLYLYSSHRKSNTIICWDLRMFQKLYFLDRSNPPSNQRLYMDIHPTDPILIYGNNCSLEMVFSTTGNRIQSHPQIHADIVTNTIFHPSGTSITTCSGQRQFGASPTDNSIRHWNLCPDQRLSQISINLLQS